MSLIQKKPQNKQAKPPLVIPLRIPQNPITPLADSHRLDPPLHNPGLIAQAHPSNPLDQSHNPFPLNFYKTLFPASDQHFPAFLIDEYSALAQSAVSQV